MYYEFSEAQNLNFSWRYKNETDCDVIVRRMMVRRMLYLCLCTYVPKYICMYMFILMM